MLVEMLGRGERVALGQLELQGFVKLGCACLMWGERNSNQKTASF